MMKIQLKELELDNKMASIMELKETKEEEVAEMKVELEKQRADTTKFKRSLDNVREEKRKIALEADQIGIELADTKHKLNSALEKIAELEAEEQDEAAAAD